MTPSHRSERAVNAQSSPPDTPLHFCQCRECIHECGTALDFAESLDDQLGCWLNATMYNRHRREEVLRRGLEHVNLDGNGQPISEVPLLNSSRGLAPSPELNRTSIPAAKATPIIQSQDPSPSITDLDHLRSKIHHHVHSLSLRGPLKFAGYPTIDGPYVRPDEDGLVVINSGPQMLEPRHPSNRSLLAFQNDLIVLLKEARAIETHSVGEIIKEKEALVQRIYRELDRVDDFKEKEWERQRNGADDEDSDTFVNTGRLITPHHVYV
jgi:hypothetical protein